MHSIIRNLFSHPVAQNDRFGIISRFLRWQLGSRLLDMPHIVPFVDETALAMERGMTGATGNFYFGLHEISEMAFVLHLLRDGDLFVDVGANVGSYTVLASGCTGARSVSIEPIKNTFARLTRNIDLNGIGRLVTAHNIGIGSTEGSLEFISTMDTINRVATKEDNREQVVSVDVKRLDDVLFGSKPILMKIDVEGWESHVVKGMPEQLMQPTLAAIIMETNAAVDLFESGGREELIEIMLAAGFETCTYEPYKRELIKGGGTDQNTVFVRDFELVRERIKTAKSFKLVNGTI